MNPRHNVLSLPARAALLLTLMTSWTADVIHAKHVHGLTLGDEQEVTSSAPGDVTTTSPDVTRTRDGSRSRGSVGRSVVRTLRSSPTEEVDLSVCSQLYSGPALNLRSTCPWHYLELPTGLSGSSPRTLLHANLTCGPTCLNMTEHGYKVPTNYPCVPVTRTVPVQHCDNSGHHPDGHHGRSCCRTELRSVPVAFTCVFP